MNKIQTIAVGVLMAQKVYQNKEWQDWASKWLSGENRDPYEAEGASRKAEAVKYTSKDPNERRAAEAAEWAARAAVTTYRTQGTPWAQWAAKMAETSVKSISLKTMTEQEIIEELEATIKKAEGIR